MKMKRFLVSVWFSLMILFHTCRINSVYVEGVMWSPDKQASFIFYAWLPIQANRGRHFHRRSGCPPLLLRNHFRGTISSRIVWLWEEKKTRWQTERLGIKRAAAAVVPATVGVFSTTSCLDDTHRLTSWKQQQPNAGKHLFLLCHERTS